jgi:hypothetical protein
MRFADQVIRYGSLAKLPAEAIGNTRKDIANSRRALE